MWIWSMATINMLTSAHFLGSKIECIEPLVYAFLFTMLLFMCYVYHFQIIIFGIIKLTFIAWCWGFNFVCVQFFNVTWISSIWKFWYISIVFIKFNIFFQMWISSLFFSIWYHPNFKLMEMPCLIIQPYIQSHVNFTYVALASLIE